MTKQVKTVVTPTVVVTMSTSSMTRMGMLRQVAEAQAARRATAVAHVNAGLVAGQAEVASLLGMGAFNEPSAPAAPTTRVAQKRLGGATLYHAKHADKCQGVDRASIPSFKKGGSALENFVITSVATATKSAGETHERIEMVRKFCGQSLAAYAAAGGDRNWLGYFADRGKVVVVRTH